jgi:pyruvate kinase
MLLVAKIEKDVALQNIEEILKASDAVMVARGDLGVELPFEEVPIAQKRIIALANRMGRPVITATQMLESMITHPRPTRAEASDVANAILDGTDAVMLSAETAAGQYPALAVEAMRRIILEIESSPRPRVCAAALDRSKGREHRGDDRGRHHGWRCACCGRRSWSCSPRAASARASCRRIGRRCPSSRSPTSRACAGSSRWCGA